MTDVRDVRDPDEDAIRRALAAHADADAAPADEAFAARVTAAVARDARRHRRRVGVLALAAVLALVAGVVAVLGRGPADDVRTDGPPADGPPPDGGVAGRPDVVVMVDWSGRLVAADLETGEERVLYDGAGRPPTRGSVVGGIDASPGGGWAYFTVLTDTGGQTAYRVPTTGGEPEVVGSGARVEASPDGRWLALSSGEVVTVVPADGRGAVGGGGPVASTSRPVFGFGGTISVMRWSPDGRTLAYTVDQGEAGTVGLTVGVHTRDGTVALDPPEPLTDPDRPVRPGPVTVSCSPTGEHLVVEPLARSLRSLDRDATCGWLLAVDSDGTVEFWNVATGQAERLDGDPRALRAAW